MGHLINGMIVGVVALLASFLYGAGGLTALIVFVLATNLGALASVLIARIRR